MRLLLGSGYTYTTRGGRCDECNRTSPTLATITFDDGLGYGGEYCRFHSLRPSKVEIGCETVEQVIALWERAESTARSAVTFDQFVGRLRSSIEAGRSEVVHG